jgi:hypothetical protein
MLTAWSNATAPEQLLPLVQGELHRLARAYMARAWRGFPEHHPSTTVLDPKLNLL